MIRSPLALRPKTQVTVPSSRATAQTMESVFLQGRVSMSIRSFPPVASTAFSPPSRLLGLAAPAAISFFLLSGCGGGEAPERGGKSHRESGAEIRIRRLGQVWRDRHSGPEPEVVHGPWTNQPPIRCCSTTLLLMRFSTDSPWDRLQFMPMHYGRTVTGWAIRLCHMAWRRSA